MEKDKVDGVVPVKTDNLSKDEIIELALLKNIAGGGCSIGVNVNTCGKPIGGNPEQDNGCWVNTCYTVRIVDIP